MLRRLLWLLSFSFMATSVVAASYERFEENGKVGIRDTQGTVIVPASFDALGWSDGNFSVINQITGYRQHNRWGLLNLKKEFITAAEFESMTSAGGDRVVASKQINPFTVKYGCLDLHGKVVIPFNYDQISLHGLRAIVMVKESARYQYGLIDLNDRSVVPIRYQRIVPIGSLRYAVQDFAGKNALCSEEGKWITDFVIDSISTFRFDLAVIYQGWKRGIIDRNGETKVPAQYRDVTLAEPGKAMVRKPNEWILYDKTTVKPIRQMEADEINFLSNHLAKATRTGKAAVIESSLKERWDFVYDDIKSMENNLCVVKLRGKFKLVRLDQTPVLEGAFDSLLLENSFIRVLTRTGGRDTWDVYDTFGIKKTPRPFDFIGPFNGKFFPLKDRGYWGAMDRYGVERIACVYDSILETRDEMCAVKFKKQYGIVSLDDRWMVMPQKNKLRPVTSERYIEVRDSLLMLKDFSNNLYYFTDRPLEILKNRLIEYLPDGSRKEINLDGQLISSAERLAPAAEEIFKESEGLTGIRRDGKFGFVDQRGRLRIANRYDAIGEFHEGLAAVKLVGKWGFINTADDIVIQPTYDEVRFFDQGLAIATRKGKSGLINTAGEVMLELHYDSIRRLSDHSFMLYSAGLNGLADERGRILIEPRFDHLEMASPDLVIVRRHGLYGLVTREGMSIFPLEFSRFLYEPESGNFLVRKESPWENLAIGN